MTNSEFPLVLIVKGPWDPQFQRVMGSFCFSGVFAYLLKFSDLFSCVLGTYLAKKLYILFIFCMYKIHTCALMRTLQITIKIMVIKYDGLPVFI